MTQPSQRSPYFDEVSRHLRQVSERMWELTEPHLLYLDSEQSDQYLQVMQDRQYATTFHNDTVQLIHAHLDELFADPAAAISLIDLGPGYPDKSLPIAQFLKARSQAVHYYPVDVSREYLGIAQEAMAPYCTEVVPIHALFDQAARLLPATASQRCVHVLIGLTFMNFPQRQILALLKHLAGSTQGRVIFASELITAENPIETILQAYRGEAMRTFSFGPLRHLGLRDSMATFVPTFGHQRVEMRFSLQEDVPALALQKGDTVITAVSYRYTPEELAQILRDHFTDGQIWHSESGKTALVMAIP